MAHFVNRRFDAALAALRIFLEEVPAFAPSYRALAARLAHMGRIEEARLTLKRLVTLTPVVHPNVDPFRNREHGELFRSDLRLVAGETT
ncbi:MAG TPA: hypothetical protein VJ376_10410 [Pseudomonadota bacterium]|nr:hypothetical protein [Stellaceae bacterium]HKN09876.1 hypothetical protein [Pseudomonadota bacterium]